MSQVTVKAYYNDLNETAPEIRRFPIEVTSDNDVYRLLETHVAQLNSNYAQGEFTLQYTDEDNDRITFSSNAELRAALATVANGGTLKVYVKPKAKKVEGQSASGSGAQVHPGVTCDGCEGPVVGIRYKCMECPNYDLCEKCSEKKIHSEHNMIKLARPGFGGRGCGRGRFGGRCGGGPGSRFWHHHQNRHQQPEAHLQMPSNVVDYLGQFKGKELAELIEAHLPEWLRTEKIQELISQLKSGEQADKPVDQANILEHVGKFLREVLSPFGIDCDYWVDNKPKPESKTEPEAAATTSAPPSDQQSAESASASATAEPKPSASASASAVPPMGDLFGQLQSMLGPMFAHAHQQKAATTTAPVDDQEAREKKKIDECVERMTAMGFVDSNGVLTELIKAKKGDMNQVLDALNPRNYKS